MLRLVASCCGLLRDVIGRGRDREAAGDVTSPPERRRGALLRLVAPCCALLRLAPWSGEDVTGTLPGRDHVPGHVPVRDGDVICRSVTSPSPPPPQQPYFPATWRLFPRNRVQSGTLRCNKAHCGATRRSAAPRVASRAGVRPALRLGRWRGGLVAPCCALLRLVAPCCALLCLVAPCRALLRLVAPCCALLRLVALSS